MDATPIISPVIRYQDGPAAIDFLVAAFGFETHSDHRTSEGLVAHADLRFGPSAIGVSSVAASPPDSPWTTARQGIYVHVANPDVFHDRARATGADIVIPLTDTDYGSRDFSMRDLEGHLWGFGTYAMADGAGEPTLWPELRYRDVASAVAWLERIVGFTRSLEIAAEDGTLRHAELRVGKSVVMLGPEVKNSDWPDLRQVVDLKVAEPDAHFARAKAAGAGVVHEPQTAPYGARFYAVRDPEGFLWWVSDYSPAAPR